MKGILYISKANTEFTEKALTDLCIQSAAKNEEFDITGFLCFFGNTFLQYIEGFDEVITLMDNIRADTRHRILYETEPEYVGRRNFSSWSMKYVKDSELSKVRLENCVEQNLHFVNKNYFDKDRCNMYLWQQARTISLLQDLRG